MASFSVENFTRNVLSTGLARKNRFEVEIAMPPGIGDGEVNRLVSLYAESAVFPEITINTETQFIWGPLIHRPKTINYGGFMTLQFHLDQDMRIKKLFDSWIQSIVDGEGYTVSYQRDYIAPMLRVTQLDEQENPVYVCELSEVFPAGIIQLDLNHSLQNTTHLLQVNFRFRKWVAESPAGKYTQNNPLENNALVNSPAKKVLGGNIFRLPPRP
jgi:hypothetical protein